MSQPRIALIALAAGISFCTCAPAQVLARNDYQARAQAISARLRTENARCVALAGHPREVCAAEADAVAKIARADLDARYRPSAKARHRALIVAADSRLAVARVRCADRRGVARNSCETEAMGAWTSAGTDAGTRLKKAEANARATEQSADDRKEGSSDTHDARYGAARRQCDGYDPGKTRDLCLSQTREHFTQP